MTGSWCEHFRFLAGYNQWANTILYDAFEGLPEWEYLKLRQAFFGSIHGTLSHLLNGDRVWFARFRGEVPAVKSLDEQPYATLAAREAEDGKILAYVDGLGEDDILGTLSYATLSGEPHEHELRLLLTHVFNHHTHHRGQIHGMLSSTNVAPPSLDIIYYMRDAERPS